MSQIAQIARIDCWGFFRDMMTVELFNGFLPLALKSIFNVYSKIFSWWPQVNIINVD